VRRTAKRSRADARLKSRARPGRANRGGESLLNTTVSAGACRSPSNLPKGGAEHTGTVASKNPMGGGHLRKKGRVATHVVTGFSPGVSEGGFSQGGNARRRSNPTRGRRAARETARSPAGRHPGRMLKTSKGKQLAAMGAAELRKAWLSRVSTLAQASRLRPTVASKLRRRRGRVARPVKVQEGIDPTHAAICGRGGTDSCRA